MIKKITFPKLQLTLCGKIVHKLEYVDFDDINPQNQICKTKELIELSITSDNNIEENPINIMEFRVLIENFVMDNLIKNNWDKIDNKKISADCINIVLKNSTINLEGYLDEKEKIYFTNVEKYNTFLEEILNFLNKTVPVLLKLNIYSKE